MPPLSMRKFLWFIFIFIFSGALAQKQANIWYLGGGMALDFSHSPPQHIFGVTSAFSGHIGFATIADADGKLLFYSDGQVVLNSNHLVMENGDDLLGTGEQQIIIPKPGSAMQYYLFYIGTTDPS